MTTPILSPSDIYALEQPSRCELRVHLRGREIPEGDPGPYVDVLRDLGERHERAHLSTLGPYVDLRDLDPRAAATETTRAIDERRSAIYQARFRATASLAGLECEIVGVPDLLLLDDSAYRIRDVKIARRVGDEAHPEIALQLQLYGWLYEQTTGDRPAALEVYNGAGELVPIEDDGGRAALATLERVVELQITSHPPDEPVGWTKCGGCGYRVRCWDQAEQGRDVALIAGVDQNLARALHGDGVRTFDDLLDQFDTATLADYERPWGSRTQRVGSRADAILASAAAMRDGEVTVLTRPSLPDTANQVMFDLEGLPPHLDETDRVYLWGMQVFGEQPGEYQGALAGYGPDGDREGWESFLSEAAAIFETYGPIPFVHWHHYERSKLDAYVERYGDPDGTALQVRHNLVDLLPITQRSVVLPLPSYSLKVIESYVGYERSLPEGRGDWSMAAYVRAVETDDSSERDEIINQVLTYNREDLEATWAVLTWLRGLRAP